MSAWWDERSQREQALLGLLAAVAVLFAVWALVFRPISGWRDASLERAAAAESGYRLVTRAAASAAPESGDAGDAKPVKTAIVDTAARFSIELNFVNVAPDGSVEVQGKAAAPDRLFSMLAELQNRHGIRVSGADLARSPDDPAKVRFQTTLAR